jgi:integrase
MPKTLLTDLFCRSARATGAQTDYFDTGCKGLALRVGASGSKTWTFLYTLGGKRLRMKLGAYPAISLAKAHDLVAEARETLAAGRDPRLAIAKPDTLHEVCEAWAKREAAGLRSGNDIKATLKRLVYPALGSRLISDIRRSEIVRLLDAIEDERGPAMADKTLAILRSIFNWHATRSDDFYSPIVRGMSRQSTVERARRRTLTDDEIRIVWTVAADQGSFGRMVRFLLLTGARRTEAAAMPWAELDGADWLLPGARNKTKLPLLRPLPTAAMTVLGDQPKGATFVFSNNGGADQIRGYGSLKLAFDAAVTAQLRKADADAKPLPNWTLHDLRRTARSLMSRAGVQSDHAERCLGHVIGGVRGIYDRWEYRDEKADAYVKLARLIDRIVTGRPTVVRLVRRDATASDGLRSS